MKIDLSIEKTGNCLICGKGEDFNICIKCDAVKTARSVMYHVFNSGLSIEDEMPKKIKMAESLKYWEEYYKDNLAGFNASEKKEFDLNYENELKKLKYDQAYVQKIFKYDSEKNKTLQNLTYLFDAMRWRNILKNCNGCRYNLCDLAKGKTENIKNIINCTKKILGRFVEKIL